jgi:hypothetical protein
MLILVWRGFRYAGLPSLHTEEKILLLRPTPGSIDRSKVAPTPGSPRNVRLRSHP